MDRYGRKQLEPALREYCKVTGQKFAETYTDQGYRLDHYSPGGNPYTWALEYTGPDGKQWGRLPIHSRRYRAEELYLMLWFATDTVRQMREDTGTDARTIAAAPAMLAALRELVQVPNKRRPDRVWDAARAAIEQATGESD